MRRVPSDFLEPFLYQGKPHKPLLLLFILINLLLLANASLHDPTRGYDAHDHVNYVESLAAHWRLPTKAETGQYYSPPLPYTLPAILTTLQLGLWKALKIAQLFNVLLADALLLYLLKICGLLAPQNIRLKLLSLGLLGMLPAFYRSFTLVRGEPYLAFLAIYVVYETLIIFLKHQYSARHVAALGIALGLSVLARQWGFFLLPPLVVFAIWTGLGARGRAAQHTGIIFASILIGLAAGGWFYALMLKQYGTIAAFDRAPQQVNVSSAAALLETDSNSLKVFSDPIRPSLSGRLMPILYADTWGDYWGYFLVFARNTKTGDFEEGIAFQKITTPPQIPPNIVTNRFDINRYLAILNVLALLPTVLLVGGMLFGLWLLVKFLVRRSLSELEQGMALMFMVAATTLLGFIAWLLRYQTATQGGDLIKATYILQAFAPMSLLAGSLADRLWDRRPRLWRAVAIILSAIFAIELPALITHYIHLTTTPLSLWFALSSLLFLAGIGVTYWIHSRYQLDVRVQATAPPSDGPLISVCVPARNEQRNIGPCMEALLAQTYPRLEFIVVDDRSSDDTPAILKKLASDPRLRILHGAELPEGWAGKPHALAQAAAEAHGEWLCFLDADTILTPEAISSCYGEAETTKADLFTIMTRQVMGTFWEKTVMPLVMTALSVGFPPREVNDAKRRVAIANGQFIMIRRKVYEAIGGHTRIKDQIVDDKALAELVKWSGYRLVVADGRLVARTRMYTSLPQMWEGWTKNIYLGLRGRTDTLFLGAFGAAVLVLAAFFLPVWPVLGLLAYQRGGGWMALAIVAQSLIVWGAVLYARGRTAQGVGISRWYAVTTPLGAAVFAAMMFASAWKVISGQGVTWRGRRYKSL